MNVPDVALWLFNAAMIGFAVGVKVAPLLPVAN